MMMLSAAGCYYGSGMGYGSYANANKIKTTAAADTLEEFKITDFQASDGTFQYKDLGWLSSYQDLEKEIAMPIGTTTAFTEGETMGDINYSVKLLNYISVGMQPVYNAEGGLTTLTVYFEDTYTAEQLDDLFDKAVAAAREAFGDEDKYQENDQDGGKGTVYHTTGAFWYNETDQYGDYTMNSFQIGKLDSGNGTSAVVIGVNIYDPSQIEEESSEEGSSSDEGVESSKEESGSGESAEEASSQNDEKNAKETSEAEKTVLYDTISAGDNYTVGLKSDGTVVAVGDNSCGQCNVNHWTDIVAVTAGDSHTVGLKSDGSVIVVGDNSYGQCDVDSWTDIVAISAGDSHTVGLKSDGSVIAVGGNAYGESDIKLWAGWIDIVAISAGTQYTVGLKSDGSVIAVGNNNQGQCDVDSWTDIVAISAGDSHTVGLKSDGSVIAVGDNSYGQCDVDSWTDIVAISAGNTHTVGLKSDGSVVAVGDNSYDKCDVDSWTDIVAISADDAHTVGLKSDGTVVVAYTGPSDVDTWFNIKLSSR